MEDKITLSHGSGGSRMHGLVDSVFMKKIGNRILSEKKDSAIMGIGLERLAFTTDTYVVNPIFFPGGDIGSLAVYGTVNDLSVCGAKPLYLSLGIVMEEGLEFKTLHRIADSIRTASRKSGVEIVTGDTKVVEKGSCDKIFINTSGVGRIYYDGLSVKRIKIGDAVLLSGPIGDHAISILSKREGLSFASSVRSDSTPLVNIITGVLARSRKVRFMRDPTRGGLATTLNEITDGNNFGISIYEDRIPVRPGVRAACELLGLEPSYLACEGAFIAVVAREEAEKALREMRRHKEGRMAAVIGHISREYPGKVYLNTSGGGRRILGMLSGEQLPRIC